jgi:hypothetical protein
MTLILIILVIFLLFGGGYGYYRGSLAFNNPLGIVLIIIVLLLLFGAIGGPRFGYWTY